MKKTISITGAAKALGVSRITVYHHCRKELLPARQVGVRGDYHIEIEDLRNFAKRYNYPLNLTEEEGETIPAAAR